MLFDPGASPCRTRGGNTVDSNIPATRAAESTRAFRTASPPDAQKIDHGSRVYLDDVVFPNSDDGVARLFFRGEADDGNEIVRVGPNEIVIHDNCVPIDATDIHFSAIGDAQGGDRRGSECVFDRQTDNRAVLEQT